MTTYFTAIDSYGFIEVTGGEAASFLQGQVTCDINEVTRGQSRLGACCNQQGRVISEMRFFKTEQGYCLRLPIELIDPTLAHLKKYAIFSRVELNDRSEGFHCYYLESQQSLRLPGFIPLSIDEQTLYQHAYALRVFAQDGLCRYEFYVPVEQSQLSDLLSEKFQQLDEEHYWLSEIRQGLAHIFTETTERFTPHALNFHLVNAINFNKGCYQGQEVIARMHYRGKLKQHLYYAKLDSMTAPERNEKLLLAGKTVGQVIECRVGSNNSMELLATLKDTAVESEQVHPENQPDCYLKLFQLFGR